MTHHVVVRNVSFVAFNAVFTHQGVIFQAGKIHFWIQSPQITLDPLLTT